LTGQTLGEVLRLSAAMAGDKLRGRKIVIVFVEELGFIQFLRPVFEELKRQAGGRIAFYLATEYADRDDHLAAFGVPRSRRFHPRLARAFLLADVFLSASVYGKGPKTARRINISHNQPTKFEAYPKEYVTNYDVHFLTGPLHREQYEHMFAKHGLDTSEFRLVDVGYPKCDALLQGKYDRVDVLGGLGLDQSLSTVLYAPAWDPGGSLREFGDEVIEQLLSLDVNVVVKLHPVSHTPPTSASYEFYTGGVNWVERFRKFEANPRFRHVAAFEVDPLLVAADLLVTDFSSVALEFVGLDKPIIYLDCPVYFEKTLRLPGYDTDPEYVKNNPRANAGRHVGVVVETVERLADAVSDELRDPSARSSMRRELASQLLYNPGKAGAVAAGEIRRLLGIAGLE
jgi:hypothetical protein